MYQRDFILRLLEMLGELVAGIRGLIKKGEFDKAKDSLDKAYYDLLKEDSVHFKSIALDDLTNVLLAEHNYTNDHLEILSELFFTEGELLFAQNKQDLSIEYYQKALKLLNFVVEASGAFSFDKIAKVQKIEQILSEME